MKAKQLIPMYLGSFIAMFVTMYVMVAAWEHVYLNINKVYMALLMVAAMGIVNGLVMAGMYATQKLRYTVLGVSVILTLLLTWVIRTQEAVDNTSFLRSMIPHHSSAILMCEQADITDPEIEELCDSIVQTQREEIQIMKEMLAEQ